MKLEVRRDEDFCDVRGNATYNADGHPQDGSPNPNSPSYDPDGGAYVKFCCADITAEVVDVNGDGVNDAGYHKVWLRVWDDGDMDGIYGTAGDNFNEAWAYVKVEDKLAPAITCPGDVTLTCDMDYTDLNMTGSATATTVSPAKPAPEGKGVRCFTTGSTTATSPANPKSHTSRRDYHCNGVSRNNSIRCY